MPKKPKPVPTDEFRGNVGRQQRHAASNPDQTATSPNPKKALVAILNFVGFGTVLAVAAFFYGWYSANAASKRYHATIQDPRFLLVNEKTPEKTQNCQALGTQADTLYANWHFLDAKDKYDDAHADQMFHFVNEPSWWCQLAEDAATEIPINKKTFALARVNGLTKVVYSEAHFNPPAAVNLAGSRAMMAGVQNELALFFEPTSTTSAKLAKEGLIEPALALQRTVLKSFEGQLQKANQNQLLAVRAFMDAESATITDDTKTALKSMDDDLDQIDVSDNKGNTKWSAYIGCFEMLLKKNRHVDVASRLGKLSPLCQESSLPFYTYFYRSLDLADIMDRLGETDNANKLIDYVVQRIPPHDDMPHQQWMYAADNARDGFLRSSIADLLAQGHLTEASTRANQLRYGSDVKAQIIREMARAGKNKEARQLVDAFNLPNIGMSRQYLWSLFDIADTLAAKDQGSAQALVQADLNQLKASAATRPTIPPSADLYFQVAERCEQIGWETKAQEFLAMAKSRQQEQVKLSEKERMPMPGLERWTSNIQPVYDLKQSQAIWDMRSGKWKDLLLMVDSTDEADQKVDLFLRLAQEASGVRLPQQ